MTCIEWRNKYEPYSSAALVAERAAAEGHWRRSCHVRLRSRARGLFAPSFLGSAATSRSNAGRLRRRGPIRRLRSSNLAFIWATASASLATSAAPQWYNPVTLAALPAPVPITQDSTGFASKAANWRCTRASAPHSADLRSRRQGKPPRDDGGDNKPKPLRARPAEPTIFERIFGKRSPSVFEKLYGPPPARVTLAYAAPEAGAVDSGPIHHAGGALRPADGRVRHHRARGVHAGRNDVGSALRLRRQTRRSEFCQRAQPRRHPAQRSTICKCARRLSMACAHCG